MTRIRIGLFLTMILGTVYAAAGLFSSLRDFGIGVAVVAVAACGQGLVTYIHDQQIVQQRVQVWARRDN
jgi:hypothetical protein